MAHTTIPPTHPGDVLQEDFLIPMEITPYRLAKAIGVPQTRISAIIHGKRAVTADTDLRLSRFFGVSPGIWLALQAKYDLEIAQDALAETLERIDPLAA